MTARSDDRLLTAWLHDIAPTREPEHLLGQVLARTARTRRRPAWRIPERWLSMSAITARLTPASPVPLRLIAVVAALLLALVVGLSLLAGARQLLPAPAYGLAGNGPIIYSEGGRILVADSPTGSARTLIAGDGQDRRPWLSFDGTKLVFQRGPDYAPELWVAGTDGSAAHKVAGPFGYRPGWVEWSADGRELVIEGGVSTTFNNLLFANADGSGTTLLDTGLREVYMPTYRPVTGGQLSFQGRGVDWSPGLYIMNRDGSGLVRLALDPGYESDPDFALNDQSYFSHHWWDSTGTRLAFHTIEPVPATTPTEIRYRTHVANVDAAGVVSNERILDFGSPGDEFGQHFIPGTDDMIFVAYGGETWRLFRASTLPGAGTPIDLGVTSPDWISTMLSPDGTQLIVAVPLTSGSGDEFFHVDLATFTKTPIGLSGDAVWQRVPPSGT